MAMTVSSCLSLATVTHLHLSPIPPSADQISSISLCPKPASSRSYMPNVFSMEVSYSPSVLTPVLTMNKKRAFRLFASPTLSQDGMPLETEDEEEEEEEVEEEQEEEEKEGEEFSEAESAQGEETQVFRSYPVRGTKVYVGNLPLTYDSAFLARVVQQYGSAEVVEVMYDPITGRSRRFAFVTMSTVEDANAVVENIDGSEYGDRILRANIYGSQTTNRERIHNNFNREHDVFVGNLAWCVNAEILGEAFRECGNVLGARVLFDEVGRSKGFGFVTFSSRSEVEAAIAQFNGMELQGRKIRVQLSMERRNS